MEEIIKKLEQIVSDNLEKCKQQKEIPSETTLDIVKIIISYHSLNF